MRRALVALLFLVATASYGQTICIEKGDGTFTPVWKPNCTMSGTDQVPVCNLTSGTGFQCTLATVPPSLTWYDSSLNTLFGDPDIYGWEAGPEFDIEEGSEADRVKQTISATFLGNLTETAIWSKSGFTRSHQPAYFDFEVDGFVASNGVSRYIRGSDGSTSASQADGEFNARTACAEIQAVCVTIFNDSGVRTALPATDAALDIEFEVNDASAAAVACTINASLNGGCCLSPPTGLGWDQGDEVARVVRCDGANCAGTFDFDIDVECF